MVGLGCFNLKSAIRNLKSKMAPNHVRSAIRQMAGYTPGEQPQGGSVVKLNTNENPFPPSPRVAEAIAEVLADGRLRKYPDPLGAAFRHTASKLYGVDPDGVLIGNGSDDILTILTRTFVPEGGKIVSPTPSYLLYKTLADLQGANFETVPFTNDWRLPDPWPVADAHLTFVANPNSPSGTVVDVAGLQRLAAQLNGPLVVDEAYADFAETNSLTLLPNVIVTRTLSKSYSLAGLRFGFALASPELVREFNKVKDSYNCDALSLAGATAALEDQAHMLANRALILRTRERMTAALRQLGFDALDSHANFVWCRCADPKRVYESLKQRGILVRYMNYAGFGDGLRISVGTDAEIDQLLDALRSMV
jgi:histidinol-phosphate aminotransferase